MKNPHISCLMALAAGVMLHGAAGASTFSLDATNTPGVPAAVGPYGSITLDTVNVGPVTGVQFTVTSLVPGYFIDRVAFNSSIETLRLVGSSLTNSMPSLNTEAGQFNVPEFGRFDYLFDTNDPANFALTTYSFTLAATSGNVDVASVASDFIGTSGNPNGGMFFAGHIKTTNHSAFIAASTDPGPPPTTTTTPPVPEPASLSILAAAAGALLLRRRKAA